MKKIMLSVIAVIGITAASQAQFRVGIKASGTLDDQRMNAKGSNVYDGKGLKGYQAGFIGDLKLTDHFYLQPQLLYSRKSSMHSKSNSMNDVKLRMQYLEVPVNLVYKLDLPFGKAFAGAGGTFSYAMGGKEEQGGISTKMYNGPSQKWRREDVSLNLTAGVELDNGFFASLNSQHGLLDVYKGSDLTVRNRSVSLSVGYFLNRKKS